ARLLREAPVNSIWEGSGNVMCLDVLRAIVREPEGLILLLQDLDRIAATHAGLRTLLDRLRDSLRLPPPQLESQARRITQQLVLAAQGCLVLEHAPAAHAEAFIASRIDADGGRVYGTLSETIDGTLATKILQRACA